MEFLYPISRRSHSATSATISPRSIRPGMIPHASQFSIVRIPTWYRAARPDLFVSDLA